MYLLILGFSVWHSAYTVYITLKFKQNWFFQAAFARHRTPFLTDLSFLSRSRRKIEKLWLTSFLSPAELCRIPNSTSWQGPSIELDATEQRENSLTGGYWMTTNSILCRRKPSSTWTNIPAIDGTLHSREGPRVRFDRPLSLSQDRAASQALSPSPRPLNWLFAPLLAVAAGSSLHAWARQLAAAACTVYLCLGC